MKNFYICLALAAGLTMPQTLVGATTSAPRTRTISLSQAVENIQVKVTHYTDYPSPEILADFVQILSDPKFKCSEHQQPISVYIEKLFSHDSYITDIDAVLTFLATAVDHLESQYIKYLFSIYSFLRRTAPTRSQEALSTLINAYEYYSWVFNGCRTTLQQALADGDDSTANEILAALSALPGTMINIANVQILCDIAFEALKLPSLHIHINGLLTTIKGTPQIETYIKYQDIIAKTEAALRLT